MSPPSVGYHFAAYYSPIDRFELGLRYAGGGWRGGARYQLLRHETDPFDMTIGARLLVLRRTRSRWRRTSRSSRSTTSRAGRSTCRLQIGTSRSYYRVWGGPKFLYSHFSTAMRLSIPGVDTPDLASFEGHTLYYGGQVGFAIGYQLHLLRRSS